MRRIAPNGRGRRKVSNVVQFPRRPAREPLFRATEPIPELGMEAGDYLVVKPASDLPLRLVRYLSPVLLPIIHDPRLEPCNPDGEVPSA